MNSRADLLQDREAARIRRKLEQRAKAVRARRVRAGVGLGTGAGAGAAAAAGLAHAGMPQAVTIAGGAIAALLVGAVAFVRHV